MPRTNIGAFRDSKERVWYTASFETDLVFYASPAFETRDGAIQWLNGHMERYKLAFG